MATKLEAPVTNRKPARSMPECDKLIAVSKESQAIGNFLEWFGENDMFVAEYVEGATSSADDVAVPVSKRIEQLLAMYYEIDLNKVENERRALLRELGEEAA